MKTILLLITVSLSSLALASCTNDEGDNDIDVITPNETEEGITTVSEEVEEKN
nr:hypothetical protein [Allomuricauda sp.]